jgi:agmatine/peptidylarginine deiminase
MYDLMNPEKQIILPAEWAEQQFVQLTWPHAHSAGKIICFFVLL